MKADYFMILRINVVVQGLNISIQGCGHGSGYHSLNDSAIRSSLLIVRLGITSLEAKTVDKRQVLIVIYAQM